MPESPPPERMLTVRCKVCGTDNRVGERQLYRSLADCSKCGALLKPAGVREPEKGPRDVDPLESF